MMPLCILGYFVCIRICYVKEKKSNIQYPWGLLYFYQSKMKLAGLLYVLPVSIVLMNIACQLDTIAINWHAVV